MARERRVLVVEDEPTIAASVAARLRAEGFAVDVAHDGPAAVAQAIEEPPDVVVLDVMLPGFDGLEVCRRLHAGGRCRCSCSPPATPRPTCWWALASAPTTT